MAANKDCSPPLKNGYKREIHGIQNLMSDRVVADPATYIDAIRELGPVFFDEVGRVWVCSGYTESSAVLSDTQRFSAARLPVAQTVPGPAQAVQSMLLQQMLFLDPPDHSAIRSAISSQFTRSRVAERDPMLKRIAKQALERLPQSGTLDLVKDFSHRLSSPLIAELLELSGAEERIDCWAGAYETLLGSLSTLPDVRDPHVVPVLEDAMSFFRSEALARAQRPIDDFIGEMVAGILGKGDRSRDIDDVATLTAANCIVVVGGGYQTLSHLVSDGLLILAEHPDAAHRIREDSDLIDAAINEFMRLDGSSQYVARRATADTMLGGEQINAGDTVIVHLAAANTDPAVFSDPRRFQLDRQGPRHLGFGLGRHHCLGAPYAVRLARWAILGFLYRYLSYQLSSGPDAVKWGPHANTRCRHRALVTVNSSAFAVSVSQPEVIALEEWNRTEVPFNTRACWHQVVQRRASDLPHVVAVDDGHEQLTYAELDRRSTRLAWVLRRRGVEPESVVAIMMDRTPQFVVVALAVAKAGGAFLLADASCPRDRLRNMVEDSRAYLVITDSGLAANVKRDLQNIPGEVVTYAELQHAAQPNDVESPVTGVGSANTAYIVFTSGSTGRPKPIAINHEGVLNLHIGQQRIFALRPGADRILQFLSPNFDGCVGDLMLAVLNGTTLVTVRSGDATVGPTLRRLMRERSVSVAVLTPSMWEVLGPLNLPELRIVAAAGERMPASLVARCRAPGRRVLNLYGPAETTVMATWHECTDARDDPPIGRPVANKRVYVLDENKRPVGVGCTGELYIGGIGVGRYIGRPDLMRQNFHSDPFVTDIGQAMYQTGDRCRWLIDGSLEFVGRQDRQVKIRGQRVELDEVDQVLKEVPGVRDSHVLVRQGKLEATVAINSPGPGEQEIRKYLEGRLHSAMIPTKIFIVEQLSLGLTGKKDSGSSASNKALVTEPAVNAGMDPENASEYSLPNAATMDDREESRILWQVSRTFAHCLQIPMRRIEVDTDFFAAGGDSLTSAALLTNLETEIGIPLELDSLLNSLLANPTPAGVSSKIFSVLHCHSSGADHV
jgi:amino acid adenylation domain-containing protein